MKLFGNHIKRLPYAVNVEKYCLTRSVIKMQISNEIIEVLDYLCDKFGIAIDWTNQNIMPYLEQLFTKFIAWELSTSIAYIVIFAIVAVILTVVLIWSARTDVTLSEIICVPIILGIISLIAGIGVQVFDIIECNVFPEKILFDYIQTALNNQ
jgi:hypothetical protein